MPEITFADRRDAGKELSQKLNDCRENSVILALPRGGVETAIEVAFELESPLSLCVARKIGHPGNPEYAVGAVTSTGPGVWNPDEQSSLDEAWRKQAEDNARTEAKRRELEYLAGRVRPELNGKTVVLVDDGMATGLTMLAAVNDIAKSKPEKIIVAVPAAPTEAIDLIIDRVDKVITLVKPSAFLGAVGSHYHTFLQLEDEDVVALLDEAEERI